MAKYSLFTIYSNGNLTFNFGGLNRDDRERMIGERFRALVRDRLEFDSDLKYPYLEASEWQSNTDTFIEVIKSLLLEFPIVTSD